MKKYIYSLLFLIFCFITYYLTNNELFNEYRCIEKYNKFNQKDFNYIQKNYSLDNLDYTLKSNIENNNLNFMCTYGLGYTIPPYKLSNKYIKKYGINGCICLSDIQESKNYNHMIQTIGKYTIEYNKKLMNYLIEKQ